jgi:hypothetical protein
MPGPVADERENLLAFLEQQRLVLRVAAHGLTDEQAAASPSVSALSIGGLIRHVALTERHWIDIAVQRSGGGSETDYMDGFRFGPGDSLAEVLALYDDVARGTAAAIAGVDDLGQPVPVPKGVPWFPDEVEAWSVRWVLLHIIEETARHAGHADIVRESIDGATGFELLAAAEGWPATPWLQPWKPTASESSAADRP